MTEPAFLLDANICVYLLGGTADRLRARIEAQEVGRVVTSAIAFAEVMICAVRHGDVDKANALFTIFPILPFEHNAASAYSRIPFKRGSFDRLIAAHALALDVTLVTNNERNFADIPELRIENWTRA